MPTYTEYMTKVQDDVLKTIKDAQDASLKSLESLREIAASFPTTIPAVATLPKLEGYPTPSEVIEQSFDFAEKFFELRKDYTLKVADLIEKAQKQAVEAGKKTARHN